MTFLLACLSVVFRLALLRASLDPEIQISPCSWPFLYQAPGPMGVAGLSPPEDWVGTVAADRVTRRGHCCQKPLLSFCSSDRNY